MSTDYTSCKSGCNLVWETLSVLRINKGSQRRIGCAYMFFDNYNVPFTVMCMIKRIWEVHVICYLMIQSKFNWFENRLI